MCMFRQADQNIIFCKISRARCRGTFRLLVLAGKAKPVLWPRGFLRVRPQICLPPLLSGPNGDLGVGVLSSHRGADWDKVGDAFATGNLGEFPFYKSYGCNLVSRGYLIRDQSDLNDFGAGSTVELNEIKGSISCVLGYRWCRLHSPRWMLVRDLH